MSCSPVMNRVGAVRRSILVVGLLLAGLVILPTARAADPGWSQDQELAKIRQMIADQGMHWEAGPTEVGAIPPDQREGYLGYRPISDQEHRSKASSVLESLPAVDLPSYWDWRQSTPDHPIGVTPAKNQGGCGSCWAFGAVGALESIYLITNGYTQLFSEQQCISCNEAGDGCSGGNSTSCYELWESYGAVASTCMPYQGKDGVACIQNECDVPARLTGYTYVPYSETSLKTAIMTAPIAVTIYATNPMFNYKSGCYDGPNGPTNHVILLCGWDDTACGGIGAWLIKNSWGASWGQQGFGWIEYNTCSIGGNGDLLQYAPYPASKVGYASHQVLDNGNGALDPGETDQVSVTVTNFGVGNATGITGILRSLTPGVTVIDSVATFPNTATWANSTCQAPYFTVQVSPDLAKGVRADFQLVIQDAQVPSEVSTFFDFIGPVATIYQNDFESGIANWVSADSVGSNDWRWATPNTHMGQCDPMKAASGSKVIGNDLNETDPNNQWDGLYQNSTTNYIDSPAIDCTGQKGVELVFKRWLGSEKSLYDKARVLVNGTEVWRNPHDVDQWDQMWMPFVVDISKIADGNPSVKVRFEMSADPGFRLGGWTVDDFKIIATNSPAGIDNFLFSGLTPSLSVYPNPFVNATGLMLSLPKGASAARVDIYDATGRLVRTLATGSMSPGAHKLTWIGTDGAGHHVSAGTYFCRADIDGRITTARMVRTQ